MNIEELRAAKAPFDVICTIKGGPGGTVVGFAQNDPLGVGGGLMPDMPVAYFKNGGWILVSDLLRYYEFAQRPLKKSGAKRKASNSIESVKKEKDE